MTPEEQAARFVLDRAARRLPDAHNNNEDDEQTRAFLRENHQHLIELRTKALPGMSERIRPKTLFMQIGCIVCGENSMEMEMDVETAWGFCVSLQEFFVDFFRLGYEVNSEIVREEKKSSP